MSQNNNNKRMSLNRRLLLSASVALVIFFGITGLVLDAAFRDNVTKSVQDRLQATVYTLLAAANVLDNEIYVPDDLPEPRLSRPDSGLYAQIDSTETEWMSLSSLDVPFSLPAVELDAGEILFQPPDRSQDPALFLLRLGVVWETGDADELKYIITVAEDTEDYDTQIRRFRRYLWGWLVLATVLFLLVQAVTLRWSLRPLRDVTDELGRVEQGDQSELEQAYPQEIRGLTENLNRFIDSERRHLSRYRNSLSDLAHSLKTPLAVMRSKIDSTPGADSDDMIVTLKRMDDIVAYQLQRARTSGHLTFSRGLELKTPASKIVESLERVYVDKQVSCNFDIDPKASFYGDEGDLLELLGNLLENAFKWCRSSVTLSARSTALTGATRRGLELIIDDDGPGISPEQAEEVLKRGVRADETVKGHGIGLAIVREIVEVYGGSLTIDKSPAGGARIWLQFR